MKNTILKIILVFTAVLELSVGVLMLVQPSFFNEVCGVAVESLSRSFAVGAISIGVLAGLSFVLFHKENLFIPIFILALYNLGIGLMQSIYPVSGVPPLVPVVFHLLLSFTFFYFALIYFKKMRHEKS